MTTIPASQPLSPQQQQLAGSLAQSDSQLNTLQAESTQNLQEQTQLQAQVSGDQAQVQQMNGKITALQAREKRLAAREKQQRAQLMGLARAMYAEPDSALLSIMESGSLGGYLTENAGLDDAAQRAHQLTGQMESTRQQAVASQKALTQKRDTLASDEQQAQASQSQLQTLATQLQTEQAQLEAQTSTTQSEIATAQQAAQQEGGSISGAQATQMSTLGTSGLDEDTINAGLASGLYTLTTSTIAWPAQPDPAPLGLSAYPDYCDYTPIQCTCYAANAYQAYTGGTLPENLGNGGQWFTSAEVAGIPVSETPSEGSVVVFSGPGYSVFGHVAIVRSVVVSAGTPVALVVWERNFDDAGDFDVRLVALGADSQIVGYIPPGA